MMTNDEIETLAAKLLPTDFEKAPMTANELIEAIIGDVDPDDPLTIVKRAANMAESQREVTHKSYRDYRCRSHARENRDGSA